MKLSLEIDWEVLIVDNGSTDSTREIITEFIQNRHPHFHYVFEPTPGKTYALNTGIQRANGEILAFTDDDALVEPDWLAAIINAFERYNSDGIGGKVLPIWEAQPPAWLTEEFFNVLALLDYGESSFQLDWQKTPRMLYGVNYAFRKSLFMRIGGFNTVLGSRGEDQELFDRLAMINAQIFYDPAIIVKHIIPADRMSRSYYINWHRASGQARAKLIAPQGNSLLGIPLFTIRNGLIMLGKFIVSITAFNWKTAFKYRLQVEYYTAFYLGRIRIFLSRPDCI